MRLIYQLSQIKRSDHKLVGGKAFALARMAQEELPVPKTISISTHAYNLFMNETGLRAQVLMEYHRKSFDQMRWEEMWDCSLRIQNMFAKTSIPSILAARLAEEIAHSFGKKAVAVRSSAVGEDSASASFAGLHESYLNVRSPQEVLEHIKLVWASTWSDAAILYRKEIGLDVEKSSMAVVIQELIRGQESGVIFGRSPIEPSLAVIEAVYGLNQGLVDGTVEPDRWMIDRDSGRIVSHTPAHRAKAMVSASSGVKVISLPTGKRNKPPLTTHKVKNIFRIEKKLAELFGSDQDVEWTYDHSKLCLLQSRPITAIVKDEEHDDRRWYLSLRRSFDSLVELRAKIENDLIPGMVSEAESLGRMDLKRLEDGELANEISRRQEICEKWKKQYWDFCIPFAHGIRLFGVVYNRTVKPENPYEFLDLLAGSTLKSVKRNEKIQSLAKRVKEDKNLEASARSGKLPEDSTFSEEVTALVEELGTPLSGLMSPSQLRARALELIIEMAQAGHVRKEHKGRKKSSLEKNFLARMPKRNHAFALQLMDLARASYRLRDDDNIYLGQIERRVLDAVQEARSRSTAVSKMPLDISRADDVVRSLRNPNYRPQSRKSKSVEVADKQVRPRQLVGQPAGAGIATGPARVIRQAGDLFAFKKGDILVCDAIDPNMTFVVPLASAIVERRGGMLIHGAIIAREYGLPCVTGIPDADKIIRTGHYITVDGYLGIVTMNRNSA
jgi:phosphohistidine swiveling domain-containing protein